MSVFSYQALRANGEKVSGELQAQSRAEACRKLDQQRLQPVSLTIKEGALVVEKPVKQTAPGTHLHLTRPQIILFTEELSDLLEAGLQLETAMRIMEERTELSGLKEITAALRQKLRDGVSFSVALRSTSSSFGELYCNVVAAGELSGALPKLLKRQMEYLVAIDELQGKVLSALVYPAFIFGAGILLLFVFMTVLVPQLTVLFTKTNQGLPLATRMLIAVSNIFAHYWWAMIALAVAAAFAFSQVLRNPAGKIWWHRAQLKLPLFGPVLAGRAYAQFAHTMSNLVGNGIPMLNGLRLTHKAAANVYFQSLLQKVIDIVGDGGALSGALRRVGGFPALLVDIIAVGEQTGDLSAAFEKIGVRYEKELAKKIQRLTSLIQPVVIVLMALLVGLVAYSIITGIFQAVSGLRVHR
jgi:type II secretory pathway component PulF